MSRKRTYTFPEAVINDLENEAKKRLIEANKLGTRLLGSYVRDILCILAIKHFKEIKNLNKDDFQQLQRECMMRLGS